MATESIALGGVYDGDGRLANAFTIGLPPSITRSCGILYIVYALLFLVVGGIEATIMRIQLIVPHHGVSPTFLTACSPCMAPR